MDGWAVAILVAAIGLFGGLLGSVITGVMQGKRLRSEELRWHSDELLTRKIKALIELYEQLVNMYFTIGDIHCKWLLVACDDELEDEDRLEGIQRAGDEINEITVSGMRECNRHLRYAAIYLSQKQVEQIQVLIDRYIVCLGDLWGVLQEIDKTMNSQPVQVYMPIETRRDAAVAAYRSVRSDLDAATAMLRADLNPTWRREGVLG